jgi:hypothetical protein
LSSSPVLISLALSLALASSGFAILLKINSLMMAEGVVSEPLLPSGDQGRKGGFATLQKWSIIGGNVA